MYRYNFYRTQLFEKFVNTTHGIFGLKEKLDQSLDFAGLEDIVKLNTLDFNQNLRSSKALKTSLKTLKGSYQCLIDLLGNSRKLNLYDEKLLLEK